MDEVLAVLAAQKLQHAIFAGCPEERRVIAKARQKTE
jgi:hypothetical protein